jgi:hypothetical protein
MGTPILYRCICGTALREWQYTDGAAKTRVVWAVDLADLVAFQTRKALHHDVLDRRGRRLQRGLCEAPPGNPPVRQIW